MKLESYLNNNLRLFILLQNSINIKILEYFNRKKFIDFYEIGFIKAYIFNI